MTSLISISHLEQSNKDSLKTVEEHLQKLSGLDGINEDLLVWTIKYLNRVRGTLDPQSRSEHIEKLDRFISDHERIAEEINKLSDQMTAAYISIPQ